MWKILFRKIPADKATKEDIDDFDKDNMFNDYQISTFFTNQTGDKIW